jgi:hypothetical protein
MADQENDDKRKRTRSPAYPFINLETAIKRAKEFYDQEQRNSASLKVAVKHWNYEEKSSGGLQTAAALISFGLLKDEGTGDKRKLQLTPNAIRILLDQRPDSGEKAEIIKRTALTPKIHSELWKKWGNTLPSDAEFRHTLLVDWEPPFNEKSVDGFIKEYKDTISFAKLTESDKVSLEDGDKGDGSAYVPKVGDYVQWESQGILQFREPKRVRGISPDGKFALVEGETTGLPVGELSQANAPIGTPNPSALERISSSPKTHMQEYVVPLSDGSKAVFQWPTSLSKEDVEDLTDSLKIVERKISRSAATASNEENSEK